MSNVAQLPGANGPPPGLARTLSELTLTEARKLLEMAQATPALVLTVRELAALSALVLRDGSGAQGAASYGNGIDFSRLSPDELKLLQRLRAKVRE